MVAGKLVGTMDGLEIPVRPEDVVLKHRDAVWMSQSNVQNEPIVAVQVRMSLQKTTRHRASTSMYSLTFCVRVMSPERHRRKPAAQAAAVMLRTPAVDGQSPASQPRLLAIYGAQC